MATSHACHKFGSCNVSDSSRTEVVGVDTGGHGAGEKRLKGVWKMCKNVTENSGILEVG